MDKLTQKISDDGTTEMPLTPEEEDTIITLVVVVVGVLAAIIFLFSMGIFIDCKTQKSGSSLPKRKRLRLHMPPLGQAHKLAPQRLKREDSKCLASDMCPNGSSDYASTTGTTSVEAIV